MSIQSGLVRAFTDCQLAREMAEGQLHEFSELLAQHFIDGNPGATEFLSWVAKMHREAHPVPKAIDEAAAAPAEGLLSGSAGAAG